MSAQPVSSNPAQLAPQLREIAPYIQSLKGSLAVVLIPGELSQHDEYQCVINDLILLYSIGVRLALVFGSRPQIDVMLADQGQKSSYHHNRRITSRDQIDAIVKLCASERLRHQRAFRVHSGGTGVSVVWGNWISARPQGVIQGVDMQHTGMVRQVHSKAIINLLDNSHIALFDVIALSPIGTAYNLVAEELALELAMQLRADKLLVYSNLGKLDIALPARLTMSKAQQLIGASADSNARALRTAVTARKGGVKRIYLLDMHLPGAILQELLTVKGAGIMLSDDDYESIAQAREQDIGAILELIEPMIDASQLLPRDRKQLETSLHSFRVIRCDQVVAGCYSLTQLDPGIAELGCFAIKPQYRRANLGSELLKDASARSPAALVTFTTQAVEWFIEKGFHKLDTSSAQLADGLRARIQANRCNQRHAICLIMGQLPGTA